MEDAEEGRGRGRRIGITDSPRLCRSTGPLLVREHRRIAIRFWEKTVMAKKTLHWSFPLTRTHTGVLLGNGVQGLMVWGAKTLNITVGRAGFWDHRSGRKPVRYPRDVQGGAASPGGRRRKGIRELFAVPQKSRTSPSGRNRSAGAGSSSRSRTGSRRSGPRCA